MTLGQLIKDYRKERGLSQRQFAIACGLSNGFISMVENNCNPRTNKPVVLSITSLKKIADGLGLSVDKLIDTTDDIPIMLNNLFDMDIVKFLNDVDDINKLQSELKSSIKPATDFGDGLSEKKRSLMHAISLMDDSAVDALAGVVGIIVPQHSK